MKRMIFRKVLCAGLSVVMMMCAAASLTVSAADEPANVVVSEQAGESGSNEIADSLAALRDAATIKSSDIEKGAAIASPVVKVMNTAVAILVALLMSWILFNSVVDLVCLCVSPFSRRVMALNTNPQQVPQDWVTSFSKLASEQAVHALMIASGGTAGANAGGGGAMGMSGSMMGGPMGGSMMGGPMMGGSMGMSGGGAAAPAKPKSTLPIYLRKRVVMLVLFGICIVVFTCTAFTDIGIKFGTMLINAVSGYGA